MIAMPTRADPLRWPYLWGGTLALAHVVFYFVAMNVNSEGGWGGFPVFVADLPASIPLLLLTNVIGIATPYALLVGGTAWWFCLGLASSKLVMHISQKAHRDKSGKASPQNAARQS
jgi:hypothetical protein